MNTNKNPKNQVDFASLFLNSLTRNELRGIAKFYGTKIGKSRTDTVGYVLAGIATDKIQFKITGIIGKAQGLLPNQPVSSNSLFQKKFRNYNPNGQNGTGDKVELAIVG